MSNIQGLSRVDGAFPTVAEMTAEVIPNDRLLFAIDTKTSYTTSATDDGSGILLAGGNYANPVEAASGFGGVLRAIQSSTHPSTSLSTIGTGVAIPYGAGAYTISSTIPGASIDASSVITLPAGEYLAFITNAYDTSSDEGKIGCFINSISGDTIDARTGTQYRTLNEALCSGTLSDTLPISLTQESTFDIRANSSASTSKFDSATWNATRQIVMHSLKIVKIA